MNADTPDPIAADVRELVEKYQIISHYSCDDYWYSCPKAVGGGASDDECNCGYDDKIKQFEAALREMAERQKKRDAEIARKYEPAAYHTDTASERQRTIVRWIAAAIEEQGGSK